MNKVDVIVMSVIAIIMSLFFWLDTRWSFFGAGVCATAIFVISLGFFLRGIEHSQHSKEFNNFIETLDNGETIHMSKIQGNES